MSVPLLSTTRNSIVERLERGHAVVADASGKVVWSAGDPDHVTYLRSSAKPMQATAMMLSGAADRFGLLVDNIAVACGSHRGEQRHVATVMKTLALAGIDPEALGCGTHELRHAEGYRLAAAGLSPTPLHNNCSGKHAGMLASAKAGGTPLDHYLCLDNAVQQQIVATVSLCSGLPANEIGVGTDGCSAPNFAMPMRNIARCFANIADPARLPTDVAAALRRAGAAMQADPWLVAGTGEFDTLLMAALPGMIISKGGAEGLRCVGIPRLGLGLAVKFESGRPDAMPAVVLSLLSAIGLFDDGIPHSLAEFDRPPVLNHRHIEVGQTVVHLSHALEELSALQLC